MMVMVLLVGYLIECVYVGLLGVLGLFIMVVGFFFLVLLFVLFVDINIIWLMILCGVGFGLFQLFNNYIIIIFVFCECSGGVSGMLGMVCLLGQSSGVVLVVLMLNQFGDNGMYVLLMVVVILVVIVVCVSGLCIIQL